MGERELARHLAAVGYGVMMRKKSWWLYQGATSATMDLNLVIVEF